LLQSLLDDPHILVYVSTITEVELFGYPDLSESEATTINSLLQTVSVIPLESQIARAAGYIRRAYQLKTPDSVIAATALFTGSTLLTRNVRDFKRCRL
jgi:predicted nucleic acid-binding protein